LHHPDDAGHHRKSGDQDDREPYIVNGLKGDELKDGWIVSFHATGPAEHKQSEYQAQDQHQDGGVQLGSVEELGYSSRVERGDGVSSHRGHELSGFGLTRASIGALAAVVAQPGLFATEKALAIPDLTVADHSPREIIITV
jgi:hypothetical protein